MEPVADIQLDDSCKRKESLVESHLINLDFIDRNLLIELSVYIKESVFSESALKCTENVIERNEGHYTAW